MKKDWQTLELCDRFFDAIEKKDYETLESCYAPEAIVWHSHDCRYQPRADNLAMLKQGMEKIPKTRFKDRRVRVFEGGFVQQHTIYVTRADGFEGHMEVCFVGYVRDGMISRAYEYFDTGQIEKFIGPRTQGEPRMHIDLGIVVRDIDACLPFYRDVLGLPFAFDFKIPGGSHMWQLKCGDCTVKLVTHDPAPDAANPPGGSNGGTGLRYWTMGVDDIDAAVAKCEAAGAPIPLPVLQLMPGIRIAMIEDPEGNVVEFLETKQ